MNCWEYKNCGRQAGGDKVHELGICPATTENRTNRFHHGTNGGRTCWAIAGTFCNGIVQGLFARKIMDCKKCDFFKLVWKEENIGGTYMAPSEILNKLEK